MPGLTLKTTRSSPSRISAKPATSGRGPTKLISPIKTLMSWGSSSIFVLRKILPTRVIRRSVEVVTVVFKTESVRIVRILIILKLFPNRPTRDCRKKPFRPVSSVANTHATAIIGPVMIKPMKENIKSNIRFIKASTEVKPCGVSIDVTMTFQGHSNQLFKLFDLLLAKFQSALAHVFFRYTSGKVLRD